ncbi:MAG TPA: TonB-dependent receptor [Chitinophagaceae bacterium]|nr:TonB-dependent receptor [Chitinophagaceae bacterium]
MRVLGIALLMSLATISSLAQVKISGRVTDIKKNPLTGASITLKDTYDGATSDSSGKFQFTTAEKGEQTLLISFVGYKSWEQKVTIGKEPFNFTVELKEEFNELKAVVITAGTFEASDKKRAATVLNSIDIATTAGSNADITTALKTLPGAQQIGEREGLFVRGGTGQETKQFIDGTLVNNPFYTSSPDIASRGRFSPFLFKGTVFTAGGYSALYGQALSSALILESIDLPEKSVASFFVSPLTWGGGYQQLSPNKKSSWGVNYGYVNLFVYFGLVKQTPDYFRIPEFHNGDANFRFKTKKGGMVKFYSSFSTGKFGLRQPNIDSADLKNAFGLINRNFYNNLSWKENLGNGWRMNLGAAFSINDDDISLQIQNLSNNAVTTGKSYIDNKNFVLNHRQDFAQIRGVLEKKLRGLSAVRFGSEYWYNNDKSKYNTYTTILKDNFASVFGEADIYLTNALAAKIGTRFEYSSVLRKANIAPRLSLAYKTGKDAQVSAAYGVFYQKPENTDMIYTTNLTYTKAIHYILNYQKTTNARIFRAEVFYKKYKDLIKTIPSTNNNGFGYAQGIEFFWRDKKTVKNLDYWVSYSYLDTKRDFQNYPQQIRPNFATEHTASLVTKRFVTKIKTGFNFTYSYATGRPYYNFRYDNNGKYGIADQGRTIDYHSLGFSVNYVPSVGKQNAKAFWVFFASITNVLGSNQVFGYNYSYNGLIKQAINPPARRFYFIGIFLSLGVDRTDDAINNNL